MLRKQKSNHLADSDVDIEGAGAKKSTVAGRTTDTGIESNGETVESRTIPVWLAASVCIGYMCSIAALFCIWEKRWNYFTSFYFICISCLTIGLGKSRGVFNIPEFVSHRHLNPNCRRHHPRSPTHAHPHVRLCDIRPFDSLNAHKRDPN